MKHLAFLSLLLLGACTAVEKQQYNCKVVDKAIVCDADSNYHIISLEGDSTVYMQWTVTPEIYYQIKNGDVINIKIHKQCVSIK